MASDPISVPCSGFGSLGGTHAAQNRKPNGKTGKGIIMKSKSATITHSVSLALALLVTGGIWRCTMAAERNYSFEEIIVPGSTNSSTHGINAAGDVVGLYDTGGLPSGFLLRHSAFTTIMVPGSIYTAAFGINNAGDIVGEFFDAAFNLHGYLLRNAVFTVIDFPGAVATGGLRINDKGDIVGGYFIADAHPDAAHGFLLTHDGVFHTIAYPGVIETGPTGISARGDIIGAWDNDIVSNFHGFLLTHGIFINLDYPGAIGDLGGSTPTGINAFGVVCGGFVDEDGGHGYIWDHGVFTPIDAPAGVLGTTTIFGINDKGQLVGKYRNPTLAHRVGFVATPIQHQ